MQSCLVLTLDKDCGSVSVGKQLGVGGLLGLCASFLGMATCDEGADEL